MPAVIPMTSANQAARRQRYGEGASLRASARWAVTRASASAEAEPQWRTVDRTGRLSWHDHRMHWMGSGRPPAVRDAGTRTKVFDYEIPLRVDGRPATIAGTLFWVGEPGGGMPAWAIVALLALAAAAVALVLIVRRRRRPPGAPSPVADAPGEAW